jgi:hypothetical protein
MDPRHPSREPTASPATGLAAPAGPADLAEPDFVMTETVIVVPAGSFGDGPEPEAAAEAVPLRPEDVHVPPPDRLPEGVTPEAENVELIFERS